MRKHPLSGDLIFSPSDLVGYLESPFASWMARHHLENPGLLTPDPKSEDMQLIADSGIIHEGVILKDWKAKEPALVEIHDRDPDVAHEHTLEAIAQRAPVIYQGTLRHGSFTGFTDFLELDHATGTYLLWDTKVARSIKPYFAVQLCCYAEMLAHTPGTSMPEFFGIILGTLERPQLRISDYFDYYLSIKEGFLKLQEEYDGDIANRPEPEPRADHGIWNSHAEEYFNIKDHLVKVAGISANQIKKLQNAGIDTVKKLANASGARVEKLLPAMLEKLVAQARLQKATLEARKNNPDALAVFEIISPAPDKPHGLALLPAEDPADVFFDMEGYPLAIGGLEYLWGAGYLENGVFHFKDWWAHDQEEEKEAFRGFILWAHARWKENPGMHIYHYAPYEVGAVRRLMSRYDTCQDEVSELLRNGVFVDLYQIVKKALRIGDKTTPSRQLKSCIEPAKNAQPMWPHRLARWSTTRDGWIAERLRIGPPARFSRKSAITMRMTANPHGNLPNGFGILPIRMTSLHHPPTPLSRRVMRMTTTRWTRRLKERPKLPS